MPSFVAPKVDARLAGQSASLNNTDFLTTLRGTMRDTQKFNSEQRGRELSNLQSIAATDQVKQQTATLKFETATKQQQEEVRKVYGNALKYLGPVADRFQREVDGAKKGLGAEGMTDIEMQRSNPKKYAAYLKIKEQLLTQRIYKDPKTGQAVSMQDMYKAAYSMFRKNSPEAAKAFPFDPSAMETLKRSLDGLRSQASVYGIASPDAEKNKEKRKDKRLKLQEQEFAFRKKAYADAQTRLAEIDAKAPDVQRQKALNAEIKKYSAEVSDLNKRIFDTEKEISAMEDGEQRTRLERFLFNLQTEKSSIQNLIKMRQNEVSGRVTSASPASSSDTPPPADQAGMKGPDIQIAKGAYPNDSERGVELLHVLSGSTAVERQTRLQKFEEAHGRRPTKAELAKIAKLTGNEAMLKNFKPSVLGRAAKKKAASISRREKRTAVGRQNKEQAAKSQGY